MEPSRPLFIPVILGTARKGRMRNAADRAKATSDIAQAR